MIRLLSWNTKDPNTAGLLRLADAFQVDRVAFVRKPKKWGAAVGTQGRVPYEVTNDPYPLLERWISDGFPVFAVEQADEAEILGRCLFPEHCTLVLGNEGGGVPPAVLTLAHTIVEIPQWGEVASLNVATAGAIVLYEWARQWRMDAQRSRNAWRKRHGLQHGAGVSAS